MREDVAVEGVSAGGVKDFAGSSATGGRVWSGMAIPILLMTNHMRFHTGRSPHSESMRSHHHREITMPRHMRHAPLTKDGDMARELALAWLISQ
jgi:hypothetical protein